MKDVYQISDLASRDILDHGSNKPARLAVIGCPVAHSASPAMHQEALDTLDMNVRYIRLEVAPGQVAEAIARMKALDFIGCNVTVPHKLEVIDCCDDVSEDARAMGAVNTLVFGDKIKGYNTDAAGLVHAIHEDFGVNLADLKVMILGVGGGAGRAVATQCARIGCPQLWLVNRTLEKASNMTQKLAHPEVTMSAMTPDDPSMIEAAHHADIMINATSLGLKSGDPLPLPMECIQSHHLVYDMIYNPAETPLIQHAKSAGANTANGLSMLLHQGVLAYECWFPSEKPLEPMRRGLISTF